MARSILVKAAHDPEAGVWFVERAFDLSLLPGTSSQ